jgi:hypothetical protein
VLYTVTPDTPGWEETAASTDIVDLQQNDTQWFAVPSLKINIPADVANGDPVNIITSLYITNQNRGEGNLQFGIGINGAAPNQALGLKFISANFAGVIGFALQTTNGYSANDEFKLYVKIEQNVNFFDPWVDGNLGEHQFKVSVPSTSTPIVNWGDITGTLSNQTDLQSALDDKADLNGSSTEIFNVADGTSSTNAVNKGQLDIKVSSDPTGVTGASNIINTMSLSQADYDAITTPDASTLYIIK